MELTNKNSDTGEEPKKFAWDTFVRENKTKDFGTLGEDVIEEGVLADKISFCRKLDDFYQSIYIRAVRQSNQYFQNYREYLSTENATNLRPLVRWRKGRPVELSWIRKFVKESPATALEIAKYSRIRKSENGMPVRITKRSGQIICVREIYQYIARGKSASYPLRMFNKEPAWVQIEGRRLEARFAILRKEMAYIREIRSRINSIHTLDDQYFEEVSKETGLTRRGFGALKDYLVEDNEDLSPDNFIDDGNVETN